MTRHPFPLTIPPALTAYILDFHWDLDLLHALDLPVLAMPITDLAHHLDLPFWAYDGPFHVTPRQVAADPVTYHAQYERTLAADLRHPLDVVHRPDDRITILDGVHRLLRAELEGRRTVDVRVLPWSALDEIAVRE
ncbi:ParB N-terminal domain-containing protein [Kribbella sp.]|uniref:ParB N-terminal domain-containing protein n=1 Tax=Kribbella sp. TaxID=1871183 RepID=UPI002D2AE7FC|nr:ParB N-terminal domain-containing protein [Kribbella sp.]HZX06813.1 ParB N-terminal domain-containing protein [Kribbella sp.]